MSDENLDGCAILLLFLTFSVLVSLAVGFAFGVPQGLLVMAAFVLVAFVVQVISTARDEGGRK